MPKRFEHRGQWPNHKDYRPLISGPMTVIGEYRDAQGRSALLPALVRYVECKCLLGGVTTSQGVKLASNAGIQRFYRGIVRNVEQTDDPDLPEAQGRIPDLDAKDARRFLARLKKEDSCFLLHLSEGVTDPAQPASVARRHFLALEVAPGEWALNKVFTGIHAAGPAAARTSRCSPRHGSSMIWSPLSNLLLYGDTARVDAAREAGVHHRARQRLVAHRQQEPARRAEGGVALQPAAARRPLHRARPRRHGHPRRGAHPEMGEGAGDASRPASAPTSS